MSALIADPAVERHEALVAKWAEGVFDSCIALAQIRREETFKALQFESFTAFARSLQLSAATARRAANAGEVMEILRATGHHVRITHPDLMRPIIELASENQTPEVRGAVVRKQATMMRAAIAEAERCQEPLTAEVVQRVARRFGVVSREEYRERKKKRERELWSEEQWRQNMIEGLGNAVSTLAAYADEVRSGRRVSIEEVRQLPGFEAAMWLLVDARDA